MNKTFFNFIFIFIITLFNSLIFSKTLEKDVIIFYQEEKINNNNFAQKIQYINGNKKIIYIVNGHQVTWDEYQDEILEAEKQERKKELEKDLENKIRFCDLQQKIKNKISQSSLSELVSELNIQLNKVLENRLKPYLAFNSSTIESREQLENLYQEFLPQAKELVSLSSAEVDLEKVNKYINKIQDYLERLKIFFSNTVDQAVENSDDTKMLKELLELIN